MKYPEGGALFRTFAFCRDLAGAGALALCVPLAVLAVGVPVALVVNLMVAVFERL